jgi:endonuclease/exonuclease/phosphatase (EEP) superfamily protein YafD
MMAWVHPWRPMRWWPILPAALFIATYGTRFLPKSHLEASKAFTVVTYNVLFRNADYLKVVDNIERLNADVVALQEMEPPLVVEIEARLRDRYPYRRYTYWQVILSRYPIMEYEAFRIGGDDGLPAQRAVLDIEGRQVVFYNVHPRAPALRIHPLAPLGRGLLIGVVTEGTEKDLRLLRARLDGEALPVIVAGDLNITDQHPHYPRVRGDLRDAYLESGWGMGFTFRRFLRLGFAMWRIDYILHSRHLKSVAARTGEFGGSDHRPVIATLKFDP